MFKFVTLLAVVACATLSESTPLGERIIGGTPQNISSRRYQVALLWDNNFFCGGSLIKVNFVLTAAHCLYDTKFNEVSRIKVRAGSNYHNQGGVIKNVIVLKNHENFNPITMENDVAIIRLGSPFTSSSTIQPIAMATSAPINGAAATVSGWGVEEYGSSTPADQLMTANVNIIGYSQCASNSYGYGILVKPGMICAGSPGKDACDGDSGGPLVSGGKLVGIVSWGFGCADPGYPGVFSDVSNMRSWIETIIN